MQARKNMTLATVLAVGVLAGSGAFAQKAAPAFALPDLNGTVHSLEQYAGKIVVLEWTNYDCPFVKKFYSVGAMQALQEKYTAKGVVWLSICSSAAGKQGHFTKEEWLKRVEKSAVKATAVLLDENGETGKAYGAKTTPHMYVIDKDGNLAYQGAIDDKLSTNSADIEGARNYVKEAIKALMDGTPVEVPETSPYGCSVKY